MNRKAYDKVIRARTVLLVSQPFFGCLALHLNLQEVSDPKEVVAIWGERKDGKIDGTMAVDGTTMYYFPDFVLRMSDQELTGVVAHEVMHCAFQHMTRRNHRDPYWWNVAGDYRINWDLKLGGFTLPGVPLPWNPTNPSKDKGHLLDKQFADMSSEEIYEAITKDMPKITIMMGGVGGKGGQNGDKPFDTTSCGVVLDAGSGPSEKDADGQALSARAKAEKVSREWEVTVRMAINVAQKNNAGQLPGHLERLVKQLKQPRVSWRDLTRQFIDQSMSKDYSWARPSRRGSQLGLITPGMISDALHHLVMVCDCSGSITDEMMRTYVSEVSGALDEGITDRLTVVYADDGVRQVDEFVQGDVVQCRTIGGGGTDFRDTFKWINENAPEASAVIYLTDMITTSFGEEPHCATLWAAYLPQHYLNNIKVPFGTIVPVDTQG